VQDGEIVGPEKGQTTTGNCAKLENSVTKKRRKFDQLDRNALDRAV
jgi:hypothetical protein